MANLTVDDLPAATPLTGAENIWGSQGGATVKLTSAAVAALAPVQDHNSLTNLTAGDAHPQYLNTARGDARYPQLSRAIVAGLGLDGGGTLAANVNLSAKITAAHGIIATVNGLEIDVLGLGLLPEAVDAANDLLLLYNDNETRPRAVSVATALAGASGFVPIARQIVSGAGLTGGGDLSIDRTLAVGAGTGISVAADSVGLDTANTRNIDHAAVTFSVGTGLTGGGTLTANRSFALDTANTRNVDHAAVSVTGTLSLSGGGDLTASRTLSLLNDVAAPGASFYYGTNAVGTKGFYSIAGISIAWGQIDGTKNADQLQGNTAAAFATAGHNHDASYVGIGSNATLNSLGVGIAATGIIGYIRATDDIEAFATSDIKFKENVHTLQGALITVLNLRGVRFDWTEEYLNTHGGEDGYFNRKTNIGVIAQEIEPFYPEIVGTRANGTKAVKYELLVPVLLEAIKELAERVRVLEAK